MEFLEIKKSFVFVSWQKGEERMKTFVEFDDLEKEK